MNENEAALESPRPSDWTVSRPIGADCQHRAPPIRPAQSYTYPTCRLTPAKWTLLAISTLRARPPTSAGPGAAYIAKLSPNGTALYAATIGGSGASTSAATVLDIDSTGAVYIAGTTTATDFPVSAGAAPSPGATAFAAKLDANGNVLYSALIGGNANTTPSSVVVNSKESWWSRGG